MQLRGVEVFGWLSSESQTLIPAAMPSAKMLFLLVLFAQNSMGQPVKTPSLPVSHSHLDRARPGFSTASRSACVGHCGAGNGDEIRRQFPLVPASLCPLACFW